MLGFGVGVVDVVVLVVDVGVVGVGLGVVVVDVVDVGALVVNVVVLDVGAGGGVIVTFNADVEPSGFTSTDPGAITV